MAGQPDQAVWLTTVRALHETLQAAVPFIAGSFLDSWCLIGSSAMVVCGVAGVQPRDVDVLCSGRDADTLRSIWSGHLGGVPEADDHALFHSSFARFTHLPLPLEVMGNLAVKHAGEWCPVPVPPTRSIIFAGCPVPIPSLSEQVRILLLFGRDKDRARAGLLAAHLEMP